MVTQASASAGAGGKPLKGVAKAGVKAGNKSAPQQGEIVWIDFDPQSGHEQAGHRPALVISKTAYNQRIGRAFVCPITSRVKGYPFEVAVSTKSVTGVVLSDHLKNVDWVSRGTTMTGEFVSITALQSVWGLIESIVDIS